MKAYGMFFWVAYSTENTMGKRAYLPVSFATNRLGQKKRGQSNYTWQKLQALVDGFLTGMIKKN